MNKVQLSQINMFNTVLQYLEQYRLVWEGNKAISAVVTEVQAAIRRLLDKIRRQSAPLGGETQGAQQVRLDLEMFILQMGTGLLLLATKRGDRRLAARSEVVPSLLGALSREALVATGERVLELVTQYLADLAEFGVTEASAADLRSLLQKYVEAKSAPRRAIADRSKETITLPDSIRVISGWLRQLDRLVSGLRRANPEFVAGYRSVRKIIDLNSKARPTPTVPVPAPAPKTEPNVEPTESKAVSKA